MECVGDPRITIDKEIAAFDADAETARAESTLRDLIAVYPENRRIEHVLIKVITINALFHARVLDVDLHPLAVHVAGIENLDEKLQEGSPGAVDAIWISQGTRRHYFSFATKFCSWHRQDAYAIYDTNMWEALRAYRTKDLRFTFRDADSKDYAGFHAIVKRFQSSYDLEGYSLKDVDKFLWRAGGRILAAKKGQPVVPLAF
jgi:hypothetical protein